MIQVTFYIYKNINYARPSTNFCRPIRPEPEDLKDLKFKRSRNSFPRCTMRYSYLRSHRRNGRTRIGNHLHRGARKHIKVRRKRSLSCNGTFPSGRTKESSSAIERGSCRTRLLITAKLRVPPPPVSLPRAGVRVSPRVSHGLWKIALGKVGSRRAI